MKYRSGFSSYMARTSRMAPSLPSSGSLYSTSAPYALTNWRRSSLTLPGITRRTRYPFAAPIIAYAMPVLPLVLSVMMRSRVSLPDRSPSSIMRSAGRSFTDPPGLRNSALAYTATSGHSWSKSRTRSSGVLPMRSVIVSPIPACTSVNAGFAGSCGVVTASARRGSLRHPETGGTAPLIRDHRDNGLGSNQERPVLAGKLDKRLAAVGSVEFGDDLFDAE